MKRIAIAGAGFLLTAGLAIFAIAVAQRDSRERAGVLETVNPDYARQKPTPITFPSDVRESANTPMNHLRTVAEPLMREVPEEFQMAPVDQVPPERWPDEDAPAIGAFDFNQAGPVGDSQIALTAGQGPTPAKKPGLASPPGLLPPPQFSNNENLGVPPSPFPSAASLPAPPALSNAAPPSFPMMPPSSMPTPTPLPSSLPPSLPSSPTSPSQAPSLPTALSTPVPTLSPSITSLPLRSESSPPREPSRQRESTSPQMVKLASAAPGARQMDGAQNPSLQIQKRAPEEVQVGQPATFALLVRNVGDATAYEVSVVDSIPRGTRLSKTSPPAESRPDGTLVWSLGEMAAGSEQVLTVELIPETEGEIGSVASVNFAAQASVRTVSTQPKLVVKQIVENKILLGKPLKIQVSVTNEGTGVARGVSLEENVPAGLRHPSGDYLGAPFGDLVPGQSRTIDLELIAVKPGMVRNQIRVVAANTSSNESSVDVEVVSPQLQLSMSGPGLRYLERQATYQVSVTNQGTSTAYDLEIVAKLPRGLQYNSSGNLGDYSSNQHAVSWRLQELPVGSTATTELTLLPVEEGEFAIRLQSQATGVQAEAFEKQIRIEGQSELSFTIEDDNDPIEVDGETTYEIQITNTGTRIDEDVQLMIELPKGAKALRHNGPVNVKETAQGLLFDPISQMRAKDQHVFRFSIQFSESGVQVVRAHLKSKLRPTAVVKEESTQVYRDQ
ncbi:MAG: hypothetical protein SGI77_15465 [Pirellulaceae bacterium]|nr:hypothetical protein [Pirellulaceae bacterium]